jgi:hypothetical protein
MRKILALAAIGVVGLVGVAQAKQPTTTGTKSCKVHNVGYNAHGTLTASTLAPGTVAGRWSGTVTVTLKRANHHDTTTTFTLTNARVVFHHGVSSPSPAAGSRVGLHGKITKLNKGCSTTGFTSTITIKKVDISTP